MWGLSDCKDIIVSLAAIITAGAAVWGLWKWKKELTGKANFEVARRLTRAVYALRNEIESFRHPLVWAAEFPDEYYDKWDKDRTATDKGQAWAHVYTNRWKPVWEAVNEFDAAVLEAEVLWGPQIKDKTNELRKHVNQLRGDMDVFVRDKYEDGETFKQNPELREEVNLRLYTTVTPPATENEFTQEVMAAVASIEEEIKPHLARD